MTGRLSSMLLRSSALAVALLAVSAAPALAAGRAPSAVAASLTATSGTSVPLGTPFRFQANVTSPDLFSQQIEFRLSYVPTGDTVPFYADTAVVAAGGAATMSESVNPGQWFTEPGKYQVVPVYDGQQIGQPLAFDVVKSRVQVPVFQNVTQQAGLTTTVGTAGCSGFTSGAAWGDVNGDGSLDLFVTRLKETPKLYIQQRNHTFTEEAAARGVAGSGRQENGAVFADYDGDGHADLLVVGDGITYLYRNDGMGHFADVTAAAGLTSPGYMGVSGSWGDYDNDGKLDLYITTHSHCFHGDFLLYDQEPDLLYHSNGNGTFTNMSDLVVADHSAEPNQHPGAGFQAAWADFNGDNRQDLLLVNDFVGPNADGNRLWQNDGAGPSGQTRFTDISAPSGVNFQMNSMGIAIADFNRDLKPDFAVSNILNNKLFMNNGNMTFTEVSAQAGVNNPWQRANRFSVTWGLEAGDFNLDGLPDLYVGAGYLLDQMIYGQLGLPDTPQHNELFANNGDGTFSTLTAASAADDSGQSRVVATADYDRDGRLDFFVVNQGGEPHLFHNVTSFGPKTLRTHWLEVNTVGSRSNRDGCGAVLVASVPKAKLWREVFCGSTSTSAGSSRLVHFGLGAWGKKAPAITLQITWPSGIKQTLKKVKVDRILTLVEPKA